MMATKIFIATWTFDETLKVLSHSVNSSSLYKLLSFVRKEVEWPQHKENINKLQHSGCLKQIVVSLRSSNLHVVNVALSILGNCCMESESTKKIISNYNGLSELMQVLKRYSKDDGVNGRVFRIIGNMCQHMMSSAILDWDKALFLYIVQFLQKYADDDENCSTFTEATVVMGVRAVRMLLNRITFKTMVENTGLLNALGALLIKCCTRWISEKKDHHILENIIKFLIIYSRYTYYPGIIQLRSTSKGDSLVYLSQLLPLAPKKIVKIIMNFIRVSPLKSDLPIPEICGGFIKLLRESQISKAFKQEYRDYIKCLCYLLEHPVNRSTDRCLETIPQLIQLLREFQNFEENAFRLDSSILIVSALNKCCSHETLVREQLDCDIVGVLVKKIEGIIGSPKVLIINHKLQVQKKRKYPDEFLLPRKRSSMSPPLSQLFGDLRLPLLCDEEPDFSFSNPPPSDINCCCSPCASGDSGIANSPGSSPSSSSSSSQTQDRIRLLPYPDMSDSEDYSPVCSDDECGTGDSVSVNTCKEDQGSIEISKLSDVEDDNSENFPQLSVRSLKYRLVTEILLLLKTYSVKQPLPSELCSEALLLILLKCSIYCERINLSTSFSLSIIHRILRCHEYFIPLMQTEIIPAVHSIMKTPHGKSCRRCSDIEDIGYDTLRQFTLLGESEWGKGEIANRLLLGTTELKKQLILTVPYIIRDKQILRNLLLTCGGQNILMDLLLDAEYQERSVQALCVMASNTLCICNPKQWSAYQGEKMTISDYRVADDCENVVTFVLDDNSCLDADRDFLSKKSSYFNSLLSGGFKESKETFVKLHHTDYRALKVLIYLLHCDFDKTDPKDVQLEISTLLDVILLCDRYLLEDLSAFLIECVQQFAISATSVPLIYQWSQESKTNILRIECIAYALVGELEDSYRCVMFSDLFNLGYSEQIVSDIRELINRYLSLKGRY
ncbi:hypothetical protein WA026_016944 [Henosepilachna vigintioctopunctata]|uniref:BTB domain-containing protein n=1 Tax=Henosepilachna vigintioctopunctata TaxID=420089 RepID=A0AAW1U029_9CUCU